MDFHLGTFVDCVEVEVEVWLSDDGGSARLQKFWGVGKICHREPWGMAFGSGGVNGRRVL